MFSLKQSFVILLLLIVPFGMRRFLNLEPYPAVLFPEGASVVKKVDESVSFDVLSLQGYDFRGRKIEIDRRKFMEPIPSHYLDYLIKHKFVFEGNACKDRELCFWIKRRLDKLSLMSDSLKIVKVRNVLDLPNGKIASSIKIDEQTFILSK